MKTKETGADFLKRHGKNYQEAGQFNVYKINDFYGGISLPSNRRDFYKISLIVKCEGILSYADKKIHVRKNALSFANPMIPYSWERLSEKQSGYFCMFTQEFISGNQLKTEKISESPLFRVNGNPVLLLDQKSMILLTRIFEQMLVEMKSTYKNKYEIVRNYVQIIIHEALKIEPPEHLYNRGSHASRISDLFLELLDRQFPIASTQHQMTIRTAKEFAHQLSVHTNHLNRALKETTGKTTTQHITERITNETKALLIHSNWDVAEIGYCLGFEHASNFSIYFKKQTGLTPKQYRQQRVANS